MRTKVTLVLLLLNVALFFFIFRFERRWRIEESWKEARRRVLGAEAADIRSIAISGGDRDLSLSRRGDTWFIDRPLEWPANPNAVSRIVNELQFLEHVTSFYVRDLAKIGMSLADYGLDRPKLAITFTSGEPGLAPAARTTILQLGDPTKDGISLYLLSPDGERIHVVSQSLARSLALTFEELHSETVFTIPVFEARSLNLQTAAPSSLRIRLRRDGSRWSFETPIIARASKTATELAINALNGLRVTSFVTGDRPAALPADKPSLRISLEGNNRRETLILGDALGATAIPRSSATSPDIEYYAQLDGRDALFTVSMPADLRTTLDSAQVRLRETRLFDLDTGAVTAVTLSAPNQPPLTLQRLETGGQPGDASAWQIVLRGAGSQGPQTLPADRSAVARLLEQLALLSATGFQSDAPRDAELETWGFNRPEREIALTVPGTQPVILQIGLPARREGPAYARLANDPSVFAIDPEIIRDTPVAVRAWRERQLHELPAGARITALKMTDLSDSRLVIDTAIDTTGQPLAPAAERQAISTILASIRSLRAKSFVLDQFVDRVIAAGEERPWRYQLEATVMLTGGVGEQTSAITLFLTPRLGGDRQLAGSRANEFNAVFEIEQPLLDALWQITERSRDPGPAEPAAVETALPPSE